MTNLANRFGPSYLIAQGVGGILWWIGLLSSERVRSWFVPDGWQAARTLVIADIVLFGLGSVATGLALMRQSAWSVPMVWALTGVAAYATLVAAAWLAEPVEHWLGLAFMVPSLALTGIVAAAHHQLELAR